MGERRCRRRPENLPLCGSRHFALGEATPASAVAKGHSFVDKFLNSAKPLDECCLFVERRDLQVPLQFDTEGVQLFAHRWCVGAPYPCFEHIVGLRLLPWGETVVGSERDGDVLVAGASDAFEVFAELWGGYPEGASSGEEFDRFFAERHPRIVSWPVEDLR